MANGASLQATRPRATSTQGPACRERDATKGWNLHQAAREEPDDTADLRVGKRGPYRRGAPATHLADGPEAADLFFDRRKSFIDSSSVRAYADADSGPAAFDGRDVPRWIDGNPSR